MRVLAIAMCVCVLGVGAAQAQPAGSGPASCHKGIFWPFSRSKGDCLTDAEKKNGQTGNYQDPTAGTAAPVPRAAVAAPPAAPVAAPPAVAPVPAPVPPQLPVNPRAAATAANEPDLGSAVTSPVPAQAAPAPARTAVVTPAPAPPPAANAGNAQCTKGILWPFSRDPGDCLTDAEKKSGMTGVYGNAAVAGAQPARNAPAAAPAPPTRGGSFFGLFGSNSNRGNADQGLLTDNPALAGTAPVVVNTPAANAPAVVANLEPRPAANTPAPPPAANPDAIAGGTPCTKGILWPFSRSKGDCLTDTEKKNGITGNYQDPHPAAAPAPARAGAIAAPNAPVAAASVEARPAAAPGNNDAACTKGILWPFSRSKGDCLTDAEKKNGQTGNYQDPHPAAAPARAGAVAAPNATVAAAGVEARPAASSAPAKGAAAPGNNDAACTKGILWPFVRSAGDCQTDAEKKNTAAKNGGGPQ